MKRENIFFYSISITPVLDESNENVQPNRIDFCVCDKCNLHFERIKNKKKKIIPITYSKEFE